MGVTVVAPGEGLMGEATEIIGSSQPGGEEMDAYERVLGEAMAGDATLFAREDYVEEAWRIVDPVLKRATAVYPYERQSWGPPEADRGSPPGGWKNPVLGHESLTAAPRAA